MEAIAISNWLFDALLVIGLLWLAERLLACAEIFKAIVLFIAFGLSMTLAWVRLAAPDVALAEAGIGAGLTGALLLTAEAKLRQLECNPTATSTKSWLPHWCVLLSLLPVVGILCYAILKLPTHSLGLSEAVNDSLPISGVGNPVTAVLLNFRGYDTLLEMFVLLLALLGVWSLGYTIAVAEPIPEHMPEYMPEPMLDTMMRLLAPVFILVAGYLLWAGADAPGGAFQAGAVLGAFGVLAALSGWHTRAELISLRARLILASGLLVFITVAVFCWVVVGRLLEYPVQHAGLLMLFIEIAAMLAIGATLTLLFVGPVAKKDTDSGHEREHSCNR